MSQHKTIFINVANYAFTDVERYDYDIRIQKRKTVLVAPYDIYLGVDLEERLGQQS